MGMPIKLLLVDDHRILLTGITTLLRNYDDIEVIAKATDGEEGVKLQQELHPDVILMDIKMAGMDGLEATKQIINNDATARILILSACEDDVFPIRLLKAGAYGYITKGCLADELAQAIRTVYKSERYITPTIAQKLALSRFPLNQDTPFDSLSQRELQVVLMITAEALKVVQIAEKLGLNPKTVNTYRYRIFEKLGVDNDVKLTHLAWNFGLIDPI